MSASTSTNTVTAHELDHAEDQAENMDPESFVFPAEIVRRLQEDRDALLEELTALKRGEA